MERQKGFTLVELMVAVAIFLVAVLAILQVMTYVAFKHMELKERVVAVNLAQAMDALVQSMDDYIVVDPNTGDVRPFHDFDVSELNSWKPIVLWMNGANYMTDLPIVINNVQYDLKAYAMVDTVNSIDHGDPPSVAETGISNKDLSAVVIVVSWKSVNGKTMKMAFIRRYFKRGTR